MSADFVKTVLICQNSACRKTGAAKVLKAFQAKLLPKGAVLGCGCLGQCGNGPTVLVMPDQIWYYRVHLEQVSAIVQQHFPFHDEQ
ncbi:MAG: (2Fe-2S) ferredoxin domain-containing protein [Cyanobacteria bacterium RM1_2_2]|nr:(2Fe-2S) ferredoxin domain-containing protein [Cyanobacteria bacterium RM1_2_2]